MGKELKRMRYFDGLLLDAEDYKLDQEYQRRLQQLHNRYLHTWGIVAGLEVEPSVQYLKVVVKEGIAINQVQGENGESISQYIYIPENHPDSLIDMSKCSTGEDYYIYLNYEEELVDKDDLEKGKGNEIHIYERGRIKIDKVKPKDEKANIILARVCLKNIDNKQYLGRDCIYDTDKDGKPLRRYAGPAGSVFALEKIIFKMNEDVAGMPYIRALDRGEYIGLEVNAQNTYISGSVNVNGDLIVNGKLQNDDAKANELMISNSFVQVNSRPVEGEWKLQDGGLEVFRGDPEPGECSPDARIVWSEEKRHWQAGYGDKIYDIAYGPTWERLVKNDIVDDLHKHTYLSYEGGVSLKTDEKGNLIAAGNLCLGDKTIFLRDSDNTAHGLGWFGSGKQFAGINVDGPVLFGYKGGILGTTQGGQKPIISWNSQGNVGIDTLSPSDDKLEVTGSLRVLSNTNPIRFTSVWTGFPDKNKNCAEISNDTTYHKALMIVGNQSAGQGRKVAIWDRLDVNGFLYVNGNMQLSQALTPSAGSGRNGIIFPNDPGGGSGDSAWIKYYARTGEACTLEIGTSNDANDHISLMASGNVGIGTLNPNDKLDVSGWMRVLSGSNPLRFTSSWSGFPDQAINQAEICNDTSQYKSLMIVGNRSGGSRKVSIWDKLDVNGNLQVNGDIQTVCAIVPSVGKGDNNGITFPKNYYGGTGDAAWIKYYSDTSRGGGENMTLEIGISNDPGTGGYYGGGDRIRLYASGGVYIDGYFYYSSSRELKENIRSLSTQKAKEILDGMNPVSFNFKGDNEKTTLGFIAEEMPEAVAANDQEAISPMEIIAVLTSVVKDQRKVIAKLQQDIEQLASRKN